MQDGLIVFGIVIVTCVIGLLFKKQVGLAVGRLGRIQYRLPRTKGSLQEDWNELCKEKELLAVIDPHYTVIWQKGIRIVRHPNGRHVGIFRDEVSDV